MSRHSSSLQSTLFNLVDYFIHIDAISMDKSIFVYSGVAGTLKCTMISLIIFGNTVNLS